MKKIVATFLLLATVKLVYGQQLNYTLIDSLAAWVKVDQIAAGIKPDTGRFGQMDDSRWQQYKDSVFNAHQQLLAAIFNRQGFPGYNVVGKTGAHHFWLMVQHCDRQPGFQQRVLQAMKKQVDRHNADGKDYAYLTDRVRLNTGQKQLYGTQVTYNLKTCQAYPRPVADSAKLNVRRMEVGLPPVELYLNQMSESHFLMNQGMYEAKGIKAAQLYQLPIDPLLQRRLDTIRQDDARYRQAGPTANDAADMKRQDALDRLNLKKIDQIIEVYGYPGKSLVGPKLLSVALLVIQHNDPESRERYLPLLKAAAERDELHSASLAIVIDRSLTDQGKKQLYGSQLHETPEGVKLYPIENEPEVDLRRKQEGLPPLADYLKKWSLNYHVPLPGHENPAGMYYTPPAHSGPESIVVGGNEALYHQLRYPEKAKAAGIRGQVMLELTIGTNGRAKAATVVHSLGYGCDEEALRAVKAAKFINMRGEDYDIRLKLPFPYEP